MTVETLVDACRIDSDVDHRGFDCVVADGRLLLSGYLASVRKRDQGLPVVALVDAGEAAPFRRDVNVVTRPLDECSLVLSVSLAHGEGRQARRSRRTRTSRLPSRAGGAQAAILDVSPDGLRLELPRADASRLGPQFRLQVPMVALDVVVRRAWVGRGAGDKVQCGATLVALDAGQRLAWERMIELASSTISMRGTPERAAVAGPSPRPRVFARVSQLLASASTLGGWPGALTR